MENSELETLKIELLKAVEERDKMYDLLTGNTQRLIAERDKYKFKSDNDDIVMVKILNELTAIKEREAGLLGAIKSKVLNHKEYYHTDIFPDYRLDAGDKPSIDQVSGKMGRHMCDVFMRYADEALAEYDKEMKAKECEHEPRQDVIYVNKTGVACGEYKCVHCSVKLKAKWEPD